MPMSTTSRRVALASALLAGAALTLPVGALAATPTPTPVPAPKPPYVRTGDTAGVSTSSATLKGRVNSHGVETSYVFQYGTTSAYGAQTAPASVGNGTTEVKVSQTITGLAPDTTYHYRLIATSSAGMTNGQDATFTSSSIPLTFTLTGTPDPVVFGSSFSISGVLSGTGAADREVALKSNPAPYLSGFKDTGAITMTNAAGNFSFAVAKLMENTQFRVATVAMPGAPVAKSSAITERVAVRVSLHLRSSRRPGFVRMYGTVAPTEAGARVAFELIRQGLQPLTVASTTVKPTRTDESRFSRVLRVRRRGLYRAFVQTHGGKHVSGHSRDVLIR